MWESQVLLTDGQVVFPRVFRFSPSFDEWSARYKWNILERAVKTKWKKKKQQKKLSPPAQVSWQSNCQHNKFCHCIECRYKEGDYITGWDCFQKLKQASALGLRIGDTTRHFVCTSYMSHCLVRNTSNDKLHNKWFPGKIRKKKKCMGKYSLELCVYLYS